VAGAGVTVVAMFVVEAASCQGKAACAHDSRNVMKESARIV